MRKFRILSLLTTLVVVTIGILGLTGVIDLASLPGMLIGGGGTTWAIATATATVEGPLGSEETRAASSDLLLNDISSAITIMRPDLYQLDTLLRRIGSAEPKDSWEFDWYQTDFRGWADTLAAPFDTSASGTYSSSAHTHTLTVSNVHYWSVHDTFMIPAYTDVDGPFVGIVTAKTNATNSLNVLIVGGADLPDMVISTRIVRMGTAKNEFDATTGQYGILPNKTGNYMQIHMKQIEQGIYQKYHKKEVAWTMNDLKAAAMEDHRRGAEFTSWFGKKGKSFDDEANNYKYTSAGLIRFLTKNIEFNETPANSNTEFMSMTKSIFTGNGGSKTRFVWGGGDWMEWLAKADTVTRQRDAGSVKEMFGITFDRIQTNYGTLLVSYHPLLDDWAPEKAIQLDMNNIYRKEFKPLALREVDLKSSGIRLSNATVIEEIFGLEVRYPLTHAILSPASST
jgi:hypothetical protein